MTLSLPSMELSSTNAAAERLLLDAAERALRAPRGRLALALHLARLRPPAPRPHHIRVARALLQDAAGRHGGQVFPLRNGDLVLLCADPDPHGREPASPTSPHGLQSAFARLFGADAPEAEALTSVWRLETEGEALRAYAAARAADTHATPLPVAEEGSATPQALAALEQALLDAELPELLGQQTAIHLTEGRGLPLVARLTPLFRELTISLTALQARQDSAEAIADPFLFRTFAARLDARMLDYLHEDLASGGKFTRPALKQGLPIHLNLTLEHLVSPGFARLSQLARRAGAKFGVEVTLMEAVADPDLFDYASSLLDMAGFALIIDGLDHSGLLLSHSGGLRPALVKLIWSPRLADAPPAQQAQIDAAIKRLGPARILLARAETEEALVWGQSRGISRYQGYFLDAVQAAARIGVCHSARGCTLRQCMSRAATFSPQGRAGCGNPALLDTTPAQPATVTRAAS